MSPESRRRLDALSDAALPVFADLLEDGAEMWRAAGGRIEGVATPVQVRWQPDRSLLVRYAGTDDAGDPTSFIAYAAARLPEQATILEGAAGRVAVWEMRRDPWLPGLRVALDPPSVRRMLAPLGVAEGPVALRLQAYRPGRRAVVEILTGRYRFFLKVVRPERVAALQVRHRAHEATLPIPLSHGWSPEHGLVLLEARPGTTLRQALANGDAVPAPQRIDTLLHALPEADGAPARSQVEAGVRHVDLLRRLAPDAIREVDEDLLVFETPDATTLRPIHGDLHEAQVLVQGGEVTGLIDLDTAGLGEPLDDWATFLAHLAIWRNAAADDDTHARVTAYARGVADVALSLGAPEAIERRTAAVILGLAAGPFASLAPDWAQLVDARIRLAVDWLRGDGPAALLADASAERAGGDESELIAVSGPAHGGD